MDILLPIADAVYGVLSYALPFVFVLGCVVLVHEWGHYQVARWCGVRVETFSIGFGPEIFGRTDRNGVRWRVSWLPLGGYVRFFGDLDAASRPDDEKNETMTPEEKQQCFHHKSVAQRAAVFFAGPAVNFIFPVFIFAALFAFYGQAAAPPRIDQVIAGSVAEKAGLQPGDIVQSVDGREIETFGRLAQSVRDADGAPLDLTVLRDGDRLRFVVTPEFGDVGDSAVGPRLGVVSRPSADDIMRIRHGPLQSLWLGIGETAFIAARIFDTLIGVFSGSQSPDQIGGPIAIAQISGDAAQSGFLSLIQLTAMLSISIGFINLLPIPLFDGGRLLYCLYEALRRRPLPAAVQEAGFKLGALVIVFLIVFVTFNDLTRLGLFR